MATKKNKKKEEQNMNPFGINKPSSGSPAGILATFVAGDLESNSTYAQALGLKDLYNSLGHPDLEVLDIVAVQTNISNGEAQTVPFANLRNFGIAEHDFLNLHLKRSNHGDTEQLENVGLAYKLMRSVGNDANGEPNLFQGLFNLIEAQGVRDITVKEVPLLLLNIKEVRAAATASLKKFLKLS